MFEYIFDGEADFEPFSDEDLKQVEDKLGVKLPASYVELMKVHNGGDLAYSLLQSGRIEDGEAEIDNIYGIDLEDGIGNSPYLVEEWEMEKGFVVFSGDGNYWLAFDYRKDDEEPAIVYFEDEKPKKIAKNFKLFLKKLNNPENDDIGLELSDFDILYTKEEFEQLIEKKKSYVAIADGFSQYSRREGDFEWYIMLAIKALKIKKFDMLPYAIGEEVLYKMKQEPSDTWPIELLNELAEVFDSFTHAVEESIRKYGRKIRNKLNKKS